MSDVQDAVRSGFEVLDIIIALQKKKKGEKKKNFMSLCAFMSASIIKRTSKQKKKKEEEDANIHKLVEVLTECVSSFPLCVNHLREQFKLGVCL